MFRGRLVSFWKVIRILNVTTTTKPFALKKFIQSVSYRKLFIGGAVSFLPLVVHAASTDKIIPQMEEIKRADELYNDNKFKELYEYLIQFKDSTDPDVLWRIVRASRDRSAMDEVIKEDKKKIIFEAFEVAKKALELGPENYACHKWYGIMLSTTGDYLGTKQKIQDSPAMKTHFEKAIELNPTDPTSRHLIGMWCFSFADLAWYERKIASVVFGSPPESTYQEAYDHFKKAEELEPSFYSENQYMLGLVCLRLKKPDEAKEWFTKMKGFKVIKDDDTKAIKKAEDQLKSL